MTEEPTTPMEVGRAARAEQPDGGSGPGERAGTVTEQVSTLARPGKRPRRASGRRGFVARHRDLLLVLGCCLMLLATGVLLLLSLLRRSHDTAPGGGEATSARSGVTARVAQRSHGRQGKDQVRIKLQVRPAGARVLVDGRAHKGPILLLRTSGARHLLRVEAEGYEPAEQAFEAREDQTLHIILRRLSPVRP